MTNLKATKRALISSVISMFLCFAMLLGTTYAWFTDSATSSGNTIVSGTLDIELYKWIDANTRVGMEELAREGKSTAVFSEDILWEPGHTQVAYLSIQNNGSLDLKYRVAVIVTLGDDIDGDKADITDVLYYEIHADKKFGEVNAWNGVNAKQVKVNTNSTDANDIALYAGKNGEPGDEHFFALSVHMDEEAGNKYQNEIVKFDIVVLAGQLASEYDSFGNTYDELAGYHGIGFGASPFVTGAAGVDIPVRGEDGYKDGSFTVPAGAVEDGRVEDLVGRIVESDYDEVKNIPGAIPQGYSTTVYEASVEGVKENNDVPVKVMLKIPVDLDPRTVSAYHYTDEVIGEEYNPNTGYVTLYTTDFSPFTLVYDAESRYVPAPTLPEGMPTANVVVSNEYVNTEIEWGNYGQWSPTEGLDSMLEAAYTFSCTETQEEAAANAYANWYCDFYVELDTDLGENEIFLGGNYGSFGWVGFHNGDVTLEANEEIPLLGSVTTNPWTYLDVVQNVGTFICGVGDVNNALSGAKFTVTLRLTNPDNEAEFYNIAVIEHIFA